MRNQHVYVHHREDQDKISTTILFRGTLAIVFTKGSTRRREPWRLCLQKGALDDVNPAIVFTNGSTRRREPWRLCLQMGALDDVNPGDCVYKREH